MVLWALSCVTYRDVTGLTSAARVVTGVHVEFGEVRVTKYFVCAWLRVAVLGVCPFHGVAFMIRFSVAPLFDFCGEVNAVNCLVRKCKRQDNVDAKGATRLSAA